MIQRPYSLSTTAIQNLVFFLNFNLKLLNFFDDPSPIQCCWSGAIYFGICSREKLHLFARLSFKVSLFSSILFMRNFCIESDIRCLTGSGYSE